MRFSNALAPLRYPLEKACFAGRRGADPYQSNIEPQKTAELYRPTSIILHFAFIIHPPSHVLPKLTLFFGEEALFVHFSRHFSQILCHLIGDFLEGSYTYKGVKIC